MSSSELNDADATIIRPTNPASQATAIPSRHGLEGELGELGKDLGHLGKDLGKDLGKVSKGALKSLGGFRTFILRGNVVDLAIGIVIGAAFTSVVTAIVSDIITPLIPVPGGTLSNLKWAVPYGPLDPKTHQPIAFVNGGALINSLISFLIVGAVLYYFVVLPVNRLTALYHPKEVEEKKTRNCPFCYQAIHLHATRCPFCTSHVMSEEKHEGAQEEELVLELPASLEGLSHQLAEKLVIKPAASATLQKSSEASTESSGSSGSSGEGSAAKE